MKFVFSKKHFSARIIERNTCVIFTEGFTRLVHIPDLTWIYTRMIATLRWLIWTPFFTNFVDIFLSLKFLLWAIYLHSQPSWALFTSNSPSQEQWSSFSTGCLFALGSCLLLSRLVTSCRNSMKSPIMISIPHNTPWQNSSEEVIFVENREDWQNVPFP